MFKETHIFLSLSTVSYVKTIVQRLGSSDILVWLYINNSAMTEKTLVQNIYARCLGAPRRHPPAHLCLSMGSGSSTAGQPHGSRQFDALCRAMFNAPLSSTRTTFRPRLHLWKGTNSNTEAGSSSDQTGYLYDSESDWQKKLQTEQLLIYVSKHEWEKNSYVESSYDSGCFQYML